MGFCFVMVRKSIKQLARTRTLGDDLCARVVQRVDARLVRRDVVDEDL